ncbi:MAG: DUF5989 family protein [Flavobacteriales bacterium]|nr:DUF5989 family protein [Flavobacteriales bacterium]
MGFVKDIWQFMRERKKFWLAPIIILLLIFGLLAILGGTNVLPYIYSIF